MNKQEKTSFMLMYEQILARGTRQVWFATEIIGTVGCLVKGILVSDKKDAKVYDTIENAVRQLEQFHGSDDYNWYVNKSDYGFKNPVIIEIKTTVTEKQLQNADYIELLTNAKLKTIEAEIAKRESDINALQAERSKLLGAKNNG